MKRGKKIILNVLLVCFSLIFLGSAFVLGRYFFQAHQTSSDIKALQEMKESTEEPSEEEKKIIKEHGLLKKFAKLYKKNSDIAGWIKIDGTEIDYPVMHTSDDEQFYIHRNFNKDDDSNGLPFLAGNCDISIKNSNFLIYGHHMRSGLMFTGIMDYQDESFYKKHPTFSFDTLYENGEYKVLAAFFTEVSSNSGAFDFYNWSGELDEERFNKYVKEAEKRSLYKTGEKAKFGQSLVTLVTCSYHVNNGRFVVIGVKKD